MSKLAKTLERMRINPRDWRIEQREAIARHYQINSSHVVFEHPDYDELICVPAHRPIKPIYIKRFFMMVEVVGEL